MEKSLEELEKEITCGICQEHYTEPKILPCCHYYCKQCIFQLSSRTGIANPFSCPDCRNEATLPQGSVNKLKNAFFINRMKGVYAKLEQAYGKVEVKCEICSGDKAESFCRQCAQFVCAECVKQHHRMNKVFAGHVMASFDELKKGGIKFAVEPLTEVCTTHDEPMKVFCQDCECVICRDCTLVDHAKHRFDFIKNTAYKTKAELGKELVSLKEYTERMVQTMTKIRETKDEVQSQAKAVANTLHSSYEELHKILDSSKQTLLNEVTQIASLKLQKLSEQESKITLSSAVVASVVDYTEQCMKHYSDSELITNRPEILDRINREVEEYCKAKHTFTDPVESADIVVTVMKSSDLQQFCQSMTSVVQQRTSPLKAGRGPPIMSRRCRTRGYGSDYDY